MTQIQMDFDYAYMLAVARYSAGSPSQPGYSPAVYTCCNCYSINILVYATSTGLWRSLVYSSSE